MLNCKVKSVVKTIGIISLIVIICYIEGRFNLVFKEKSSMSILSSEFEVFGTVQGVFFRKNTEEQAKKLGLRGYCMNTKDGTVKGEIQGEEKAFNEMKNWLSTVGSSQSQIERATFTKAEVLSDYSFPTFEIRRVPKN